MVAISPHLAATLPFLPTLRPRPRRLPPDAFAASVSPHRTAVFALHGSRCVTLLTITARHGIVGIGWKNFSPSFVLAVVVCLVNPTAWLDPSTPVHIFPRRRWRKKGDQSIRVVFHPFCKFAAYVVHVLQKTSARMVCSLPLSLQRFSIYGWEQHRLFDMNNSMLHVVLISDRGQIFQFRYPPL